MRKALVFLAGAALASSAFAQAINIDFGREFGTPDAGYGGAALQFGAWNEVAFLDDVPTIVDVSGFPTGVTLSCDLPFGSAAADIPRCEGEDAILLEDYLDLHSVPATLTISGLEPGKYALYVYAWAPDIILARTSVSVEDRKPVLVGGLWAGKPLEGFQYARFEVHVKLKESVNLRLFGIGKGTLNGIQIVPLR